MYKNMQNGEIKTKLFRHSKKNGTILHEGNPQGVGGQFCKL